MHENLQHILDLYKESRRSDTDPPVRTVLGGTTIVREAIKDDAMRLPFDTAREYLRRGAYLDPVLASHLGRKLL